LFLKRLRKDREKNTPHTEKVAKKKKERRQSALDAGHLTANVRKCRRGPAVLVGVVKLAVGAELRSKSELQSSHSLFDQAPVRDELLEHLERIVRVRLRHRLLSGDAGRACVHAGARVPPAVVPPFQSRNRGHGRGTITLTRRVGHPGVRRRPVAGPVGQGRRARLEAVAQLQVLLYLLHQEVDVFPRGHGQRQAARLTSAAPHTRRSAGVKIFGQDGRGVALGVGELEIFRLRHRFQPSSGWLDTKKWSCFFCIDFRLFFSRF